MHLLLYTKAEEYTPSSNEAIAIEIRQTDPERIAQSVHIFINSNFWMKGPPRYTDSDGDLVILEDSDAYMAAVSDVLAAGDSAMVVLIEGSYKYESPATSDVVSASATPSTTNEPTATSEETPQLPTTNLLDSVMEKVREEIRAEVKRELDVRLCSYHLNSPTNASQLPSKCPYCSRTLHSLEPYFCADTEAKCSEDSSVPREDQIADKEKENSQQEHSQSNDVQLREVFTAHTGAGEAEAVSGNGCGEITQETTHVTTFPDLCVSSEFHRSTMTATAGVVELAEEFFRVEKQISTSSPQSEANSDAKTEIYYGSENRELHSSATLGVVEKLSLESNQSKDLPVFVNSNGSVVSSISMVTTAERKTSDLEQLNGLVMSTAEKCWNYLDRSSHPVCGDNVDFMKTSQLSEATSEPKDHQDRFDGKRFVCLHEKCNYAMLTGNEVFSHNPHHMIVRPGLGMRLEDLVSSWHQVLSKSGVTSAAQLSQLTFARPVNRLLPHNEMMMDAQIEQEGEVALMAKIDGNRGTFWKQWTIRNSGSLKWKNVVLELISHTANLEPFFCSISLPNCLNIGRSLDVVVWMNAPLETKPCRAIWRLAMPRDASVHRSRFFGPPLIFHIGLQSSSQDDGLDMVQDVDDSGSEGVVSTVLDSDFDLIENESLSHVGDSVDA